MHCGKFQEGANPNPKRGGNPILNIGRAYCHGEGEINPGGGGGRKSTPLPPP